MFSLLALSFRRGELFKGSRLIFNRLKFLEKFTTNLAIIGLSFLTLYEIKLFGIELHGYVRAINERRKDTDKHAHLFYLK